MKKIWKLQRPLFSAGAQPMVMAYTKNKAQMAMIPMGDEIIEELFGDEPKVYVRASVKNGVLKVTRLLPEQDW